MRTFSAVLLAVVMGVAADAANPGPDPPAGNYAIRIRLNDGEFSEVPFGEPCVFPSTRQIGGVWVWGLEVHGEVDLPAPNPGGASQWAVKADYIKETMIPADPTGTNYPTFTAAWTAAGNGQRWALWVPAKWDFARFYDLPAGSYEAGFGLWINSPGTGGWMYTGLTTKAYWTW